MLIDTVEASNQRVAAVAKETGHDLACGFWGATLGKSFTAMWALQTGLGFHRDGPRQSTWPAGTKAAVSHWVRMLCFHHP